MVVVVVVQTEDLPCMLNHVTVLIDGGGVLGVRQLVWCRVVWFHVYINLQLKISDQTNGSKDGKRDILLFAL